jgi:hypothetical protein
MASDQLTGASVRVVCELPNGDRKKLFQGINEQTGPGGSPDGVQATVKDNELPYMPLSSFACPSGSKIIVQVKLSAADGADASDSVINIPVRDQSGNQVYLNRTDISYTADFPASSPASVWLDCGAGYTVPDSTVMFLGGGKYFISVEDDA